MPQRQQIEEHRALDRPEIRLALAREDRRDRAPFPRLDALVDVFDPPVEPLAQARASVVLPAAMKPTRYTLSAFTGQCRQRVEETGIRDRNGVGPRDEDGALGAERGDGERHREAWSPAASAVPPVSRRPPCT